MNKLRGPYVHGAVVVLIFLVLGAAALDSGSLLMAVLIALVPYAFMVLIATRRARVLKATKLDAGLVRWGFLPIVFLAMFVFP